MKRTLLLLAFAITVVVTPLSAQTPPIVIKAGTLIDGRGGTQTNVAIVVQDSKIVRIEPARAGATYDLSTQTVMPGMIDTHTHIFDHFNQRAGNARADDALCVRERVQDVDGRLHDDSESW